MSGGVRVYGVVVAVAVVSLLLFAGAASAAINVNTTGWWRSGDVFNASATPIQAAIDNATSGDVVYVWNGSYTENVDIATAHLTLTGEGRDVVNVTAASSADHVFDVQQDYVNISGFNLSGAAGSGRAGIYLNGRQHCNISDNNASGNYYGIYLQSSSNNNLTSNNAVNNTNGIYMRTSSNNNLTSNNVSLNINGIYLYSSSNYNNLTSNNASLNDVGIYLYSSSNYNNLTSNNVSSNGIGIHLYPSSNYNNLTSNNAVNNTNGIYLRSSSNNTLTSNNVSLGTNGIYLRSSTNNTLTSNNASSNTNIGIYMDTSTNNTLTSNIASSNTNSGIYLYSSSNYNNLTSNNVSSNTNSGINLRSSSNNTLTSNNASSNSYGVNLRTSSNNALTSNNASSNTNGIYLYSSSNYNTFTSNIARSNTNYGIHLQTSNNHNTFTSNNVSSNTNIGIYLQSSSNNTIYNNHFNNTNNAQDNTNNIWNTTPTPGANIIGGTWLGGNHWSDYSGVDQNGDGLGDTLTPYNTSITNGGDYHPLVQAAGGAGYIPPDPTTLANTTGNFWVNHAWSPGSGNVTDSYNVSVNGTWHNATTNAYWNNTPLSPHGWSNITVYAWNSSAGGNLSAGNVSQNTRIPNNPITITNTSGWNGNEGANVYVDYDATDPDSDTPTFSCNRTDRFTDFNTATGQGNWTSVAGTYYVDFGVSDGWGSTSNYTMTITVGTLPYIPPDPTTLANTTGNFWVNHTWSPGSGNVTDSYNVSVNQTWHNATTNAYWNNTPLSPHGWSNITVYAYNETGVGALSAGNVSQNTRIPNNPITITNTSGWSGSEGENVYVDYDATDPDSDTPTFSCNRTDLFTDFNPATGQGNWTSVAGTYYVDFGVSDGWGSTSNYTMTITVGALSYIPPDPTTLQNTTGNFWVNHAWSPGSGNVTDSYNVSVNGTWHNATTNAYWNNTPLSPHGWSNITVYAWNSSAGNLSAGNVSQNTRIPNNPITITNTSDWSGSEGENVYVDYDATDADSDTPTFSCNRTDMFTDFSTSTGHGNWTAAAGVYTVDFGVSDGWGSSDNYTMTITVASDIPVITLVSFTPDTLLTNYTGYVNVSFGVSHTDAGLNISSLAFLYGINYTVTGDHNNSVRAPSNEICAEMDGHGKILRGQNRNATPYLTWEFNDTITGGDVYTWGGGDHARTWITTNVINSTYTFINISEHAHKVFPTMAYLGRSSMFEAEKTGFAISKANSLITKMWNIEKLNGRTDNFIASMYFDTDVGATAPNDDIIIWRCNNSYDPTVDDYETCPFCSQVVVWNETRWMDHEYVPHTNASYSKPLLLNVSELTNPTPDTTNYVIFASNTVSSKPYILNVTNADPGITNITFAQTATCWDWSVISSSSVPYAYTPSAFYTFVRDYEELEVQLYVAGNNSIWGTSGIHNKSIGLTQYPVGPVSIEYFNMTCPVLGYTHDTMMDATYDSGSMYVGIHCPADPDGGNVTHNLTLHYMNNTLVGIINNTFTTTGAEVVEINFTTTPYYSTDDLYTLKCVSTDEEGSVATKWLDSYFTLAADGTQGWVMNDMLLFWGMNDIPTLYAVVNNSSLISYDAGGDIYTMHVPFFKSKCNDTFRFNETVHLESLNTEDVAYFRFAGATIFDNATVHGWNTTTNTVAPNTDTYRGYLFSCCRTCGNMTNSNLSYLGSDIYRQEGLNFVSNPMDYRIHNTTLSHNSRGVILESCENMTITNCTITNNAETGIGIYFTDNTSVENSTITDSGYDPGIYLYEASNSTIRHNTIRDCVEYGIRIRSNSNNNTLTGNNITGSGIYDYYLSSSSTDNTIIDPESATDMIRATSTSSVTIRNTDNQVFAEDSVNQTYAYPANFSMDVSGVTQTFNITQLNLTATPSTDRILLWNASEDGIVTFNASNDTANPQVWFNITKTAWANSNITVYRNDTEYYNDTADANGFFPYNYTGGWSGHWFKFSPSNLAPDKPSLVAPTNGATGQSTNPTLQVTVTDPDLDTMNVSFYQQGGGQIGSTQTGIASGSTASVIWSGRSYSTLYYWYAVADDGNATTQSDTWHFTTQSSGGSHAITINDCNNRNTPEGGLIYNDFNYTNADPDAPVFTTNATEGNLDSGTGIFSWTTDAGDEGVYTWWFKVQNAYGNSDTCTVTFTVTHTDVGPPTNLQNTTGNFWVRHTWNTGIKTDSFNVSVNNTWHNGTTNTYWNNTPLSPHAWSNISIAGYNTTTGNTSSFISENTQIPNNPVTITNTSDWNGYAGENVYVDYGSTDADSDTPTYSCSRTDLFTDFNTATGTGNWTPGANGTYHVDFGVSDGWGSTSNYTMDIQVGAGGGIQTETKIPVSIFITLTVLLFCLITYVYYAKTHISRIFTTLITAWIAFMLSQMIVSGNVVQTASALNSTDVWTHDTIPIQIPGLSYLLLFIAVIMSIFLVKFVITFGLEVIREAQREKM